MMKFVITLICLGAARVAAFTVDNEIALKFKLIGNVSGIQTVRPDSTTLIELAFQLLSINKVDVKTEQFGISGWWSVQWKDSRLSWENDMAYRAIPVIQVSSKDIWTPALVVDNSIDDLSAVHEDTIPIRIKSNGNVTWNPPGILTTSCVMDVTYFPFDRQTCTVQITSFGYTIQELDIFVEDGGMKKRYFSENGEWSLTDTWNERSEYTEDGYTYAKVTFSLEMLRRPTYYGLNTMLPVLLTSLLIPLVFLLPHDSGEKIGYCLTVLLAYVVILTIVTDGLPTTAKNQSLLGVYIALVLSMSGLSVLLTIHSLRIFHRREDRPIPDWQARLTRVVHKVIRCSRNRSAPVISPTEDQPEEKKRRLPSAASASSSASGSGDLDVSWNLVGSAYDAFLLRIYFVVIIISSVIFLMLIVSNQF